VHERDRVNVLAIRHLWRALRPPLDAVHDRAYELFNIQGNVWVAPATYAPTSNIVRALGGSFVKVKSRSPASSRLSATALCRRRHLRRNALRRFSTYLQNSRLRMTSYGAEIGALIATTDRCFKVQTGEIVMARYEDRGRKPSRSWTGDHALMMVIVTTVMLAIPCLLVPITSRCRQRLSTRRCEAGPGERCRRECLGLTSFEASRDPVDTFSPRTDGFSFAERLGPHLLILGRRQGQAQFAHDNF
jgi:hypothetical protein